MFRIIKYTLLVIAPIILMGLLYLSLHGLPKSLTRDIERQLQFSGMVLSLDKIKLGVFEGIIATSVRYYRRGDIGDPVFEAEKIVLRFDPRLWLKGNIGVTGGRIRNGIFRLMIVGGSSGEPTDGCPRMLTFDRLQGNVKWDQASGITVEEFSTCLPGIQVTGRGVLSLPAPSAAAPAAPADDGRTGERIPPLAIDILRACQEVRLNNMLNAEVVFRADASDIRKLILRVKLDSRDTRVGQSSAGAWRAQLAIRGAAAQGVLELKNASVQGVWLEQAVCRFACDEQALTIERLKAVVGRGTDKGPVDLALKYGWQTTEFEGNLAAKIDPRQLLPAVRQQCPAHAWILESIQCGRELPALKGTFKGKWKPAWDLDLAGQMQSRDLSYCGLHSSTAQLAIAVFIAGNKGVVTLRPIEVVCPEGSGQGWVLVDLGAQAVSFDATSTLSPYAVASVIHPFIDNLVRQFRFEGPVRASGWGTVSFVGTLLDNVDLAIEARRSGWKMFLADSCALNLNVVGDHTEISDIRGTIYGGRFDGRTSISVIPGAVPTRYEAEGDVRDVDVNRMLEALTGQSTNLYEGTLSAHVELEGAIGEGQGRSARGKGWVEISDGRIFQIPLFGGLSDFLARVIPGISSLLRQTDVKAAFVIADGKIHSDEILVEGDVLSLVGKGDYALDGTLDFTVQVKLLRKHTLAADVFRFVTQPFSKILEFHLDGSVASPRWRPVNIPKEVFLIFD